MWYTAQPMLSRNCPFNWGIGIRGGGKTFEVKTMGANDFIKRGHEFVYMRRTEAERDESKFTFWPQLQNNGRFTEYDMKCIGNHLYIDGVLAGHVLALSTMQKMRSVDYSKVKYFFFDEFLIERDKKGVSYFKDEPNMLASALETVFRARTDVRFVAMANATSIDNPYFRHFGIRPRRGSKFTVFKDDKGKPLHCIELWADPEYTAMKKEQAVGRLTAGTPYGEYMYDNQFLNDNYDFVERMTGSGDYQCTLYFEGRTYGVYWQSSKGIYHVNRSVNQNCKLRFAFTTDDHKPNLMLFANAKKNPFIKRMLQAHDYGCLYFGDHQTKLAVYTLFDYIK